MQQHTKLLTLCLVTQPPRILLGMKKRGFGAGRWNGFGGKVATGETIESAARRETLEEAGIVVKNLDRRGIIDFSFQENHELLQVHVFAAKDFDGVPTESEEMKPAWFDIAAIPFNDMWPDDKYWLPVFLDGKNFTGRFLFDSNDNILDHHLTVTG